MKRTAFLLALCVCLLLGSFASSAPPGDTAAQQARASPRTAFVLPASLKQIGEEAFAGTGTEAVILPDALLSIGDRAFAQNSKLRTVRIPESVKTIGDHAFEGSYGLTILGTDGSYAAEWARTHSIAFARENAATWLTRLGKLLRECDVISLSFLLVCPRAIPWRRRRTVDAWRSMRPQDRAELYPINYRFP